MYHYISTCIFFFFFFQAEDGIRDRDVTGVQTCALPISRRGQVRQEHVQSLGRVARRRRIGRERAVGKARGVGGPRRERSEERRVGKECRCRGARYPEKKK